MSSPRAFHRKLIARERISTAPSAEQQVTSTSPKPGPNLASLPEPPPKAQVDTLLELQTLTRYVIGRKAALRAGPGKTFGLLGRYDSGREIKCSKPTATGHTFGATSPIGSVGYRRTFSAINSRRFQRAEEKLRAEPEKKREAPPAPDDFRQPGDPENNCRIYTDVSGKLRLPVQH
jgi:hypothetical protein